MKENPKLELLMWELLAPEWLVGYKTGKHHPEERYKMLMSLARQRNKTKRILLGRWKRMF